MNHRLPLVITALALALASACTTQSPGTPLPARTTTPTTPNNDLPTDGAPKVENPLDAAHFEQNPCDVLTRENAQTLNVSPDGEQTSDSLGKTCYWRNSQTRGSVAASFFSGNHRGLSSIYREANGSHFPYFEPVDDVERHPAVAYNVDEKKPKYTCTIAVGLSDQLAFTARVSLSDANVGHRDPCEAATQVAGMMMKTMQEAA